MRYMKLRHIAEVKNSNVDKKTRAGEHPVRLCNYVDVYKNSFIDDTLNFMSGSATEEQIELLALRKGDIVITKDSEEREDIGVPALVRTAGPDLVCGYHLTRLRIKSSSVESSFLYYALLSRYAREAFSNAAFGTTRFGMTIHGIKNISVCIPEKSDQINIIRYLDEKVLIIDNLIQKKNDIILTLNEARLSEVSSIIDSQFSNKKSKISTKRLKYVCKINPEKVSSGTDPLWEFDYIDIGGVSLQKGIHRKMRTRLQAAPDSAKSIVKEEDILVSNVRTYLRSIAMVKVSNAPQVASTGFTVLRAGSDITAKFLYYAVQSSAFIDKVSSKATGATYPTIRSSTIGSMKIPVPPLKEQEEVTRYLDRKISNIDNAIALELRSISLLKELRVSIITCAVSGNTDACLKGLGTKYSGLKGSKNRSL